MAQDTNIVIAGGGLNGCALALAFSRAGLSVMLVDPHGAQELQAGDFDGRGYALAISSQRLLDAIGVWRAVAADSQPILEVKVSDGRVGEPPSRFVLEMDHADLDDGPMGYMVEDRFLRRALLAAVQDEPGIDYRPRHSVVGQRPDAAGIEVELDDERKVRAALLIGCDGRSSAVAQRAGIGRTGWDYGQSALVCAIRHERPHHGVAHQYFLPPGPLAILPLPGNQSSIVWTETHTEAARIQALDDAGYLETLRPRFGDFLGGIGLAGKRFTYPLGLSLANSLTAERVALVGDAGHRLHPIAGQGLNAGLKDVGTLAEVVIRAARRGEDIGRQDVLDRYARWRSFDLAAMAAATDGFNRLFSTDNSALRLARDIGMGAVNAWPALKRALMREAAGLTGEVPRLLQGRQI